MDQTWKKMISHYSYFCCGILWSAFNSAVDWQNIFQSQLRRRVMSINFTAVWPGLLSTSTKTLSLAKKKLAPEADPRFLNGRDSLGQTAWFRKGVQGKILRQLTQTVQSVIFAVYFCCYCRGLLTRPFSLTDTEKNVFWHLCLRKRTDFGSSLLKFLKIINFLQKLTYVLNIIW